MIPALPVKQPTANSLEPLRQIKLIEDILVCTDRVLNPSALQKKEGQDALDLIKQLEISLAP